MDLSSLGIDSASSQIKRVPLPGGGTRLILTSLGGADFSSLSAASVEGKIPMLFTQALLFEVDRLTVVGPERILRRSPDPVRIGHDQLESDLRVLAGVREI